MSQNMPSVDSLFAVWRELKGDEQVALVDEDNDLEIREWLQKLADPSVKVVQDDKETGFVQKEIDGEMCTVFVPPRPNGSLSRTRHAMRRMRPPVDYLIEVWTNLTPEQRAALVNSDNRPALKKLLRNLATPMVEPLEISHPLNGNKNWPESLNALWKKWDRLGWDNAPDVMSRSCWYVPIIWRVPACIVQSLAMPDPEQAMMKKTKSWLRSVTGLFDPQKEKECHVFFIPKALFGGMSVEAQKREMAKLRAKYGLPQHHLSTFGSCALITSLAYEAHHRYDYRLRGNLVRTDSLGQKPGHHFAINPYSGIGSWSTEFPKGTAFLYREFTDEGWPGEDGKLFGGVFPIGIDPIIE